MEPSVKRICKTSMRVQSLLFSRKIFTPMRAETWALEHGFRATKLDVTDRYIRVRQEIPKRFKVLRITEFGRGIKAIMGCTR